MSAQGGPVASGTYDSQQRSKSRGSHNSRPHTSGTGTQSHTHSNTYEDDGASTAMSYVPDDVLASLPQSWRALVGQAGGEGGAPDDSPRRMSATFEPIDQEEIYQLLGLSPTAVQATLQNLVSQQRLAMHVGGNGHRRTGIQNSELNRVHSKLHEIVRKMNFRMLRVFSDPLVKEMVSLMTVSTKKAGDWVFHKGDLGDSFYFLFRGECECYFNEKYHPVPYPHSPLVVGDQFGEVDNGDDNLRDYGVKCLQDCIFGVVDRRIFARVHSRHRMLEIAGMKDFLKATPPFCFAGDRILQWLARTVKPRFLDAGSVMQDSEDEIFCVVSGELQICGSVEISPRARAWEAMKNTNDSYGITTDIPEENLRYHNVPWGVLERGAIWGHDRALLPAEARVWSDGCEFPHYFFNIRKDTKLLVLNTEGLGELCKKDKNMAEWLMEHARINHGATREIVLQILMFVLKHDFKQKFMQYIKQINEVLQVMNSHKQGRMDIWVSALRQKTKGHKNPNERNETERRTDAAAGIWMKLIDEYGVKPIPKNIKSIVPPAFYGKFAKQYGVKEQR